MVPPSIFQTSPSPLPSRFSIRPLVVALGGIALCGLYLQGFSMLVDSSAGVVRKSNYIFELRLALWAGYGLMGLLGWGGLGYASTCWRRGWKGLGMAFGVSGLTCLVSVAVMYAIKPKIERGAEINDLKRVGMEELRAETMALVASGKRQNYRWRYFGGEIPPEDLPPKIRQLAVRAGYVTVSDDGVVLCTDGMGGWRGGYMILPTGTNEVPSRYAPPRSFFIADGFHYVVEQ